MQNIGLINYTMKLNELFKKKWSKTLHQIFWENIDINFKSDWHLLFKTHRTTDTHTTPSSPDYYVLLNEKYILRNLIFVYNDF